VSFSLNFEVTFTFGIVETNVTTKETKIGYVKDERDKMLGKKSNLRSWVGFVLGGIFD